MSVEDGIDIVIVNDNNAGYIEQCVNAILKYSQGLVNLVVVDQNSIDESKNWLITKRLSHLILNSKNTGEAEGRNQGIRAGRYSWICIVDPLVEVVDAEWIDKLWNYVFVDHVAFIQGAVNTQDGKRYIRSGFCMVSRNALREIGLFDKGMGRQYDLDLCVRLVWEDYQMAYCPDVKSYYRGNKWREQVGLLSVKYSTRIIEGIAEKIIKDMHKENELIKEVSHA
jgi:GT2 family glycosyltransferase